MEAQASGKDMGGPEANTGGDKMGEWGYVVFHCIHPKPQTLHL